MMAEASAGAVGALEVTLGKLAAKIDEMSARQARLNNLWQQLHVVPLVFPPLLASGTSQAVDRLQPKDGYWWDVRRLTAWGFTAGTVTIFLNDVNGEQLAVFPSAGQFTWSGQVFLGPRDQLIAVAAGITGNVQIQGQAIEISDRILPDYLL